MTRILLLPSIYPGDFITYNATGISLWAYRIDNNWITDSLCRKIPNEVKALPRKPLDKPAKPLFTQLALASDKDYITTLK